MKNMKKIASLLLALVMVLSLATTAFAADADLTGHEYKAYQIFAGTQADGTAELADVVWGNGVDGAALLAALKADATLGATFAACADADDVALAMKAWGDNTDNAKAFAKLAYANKVGEGVACQNGTTTLDAGYYLVVDVTDLDENADNTVLNLALLQLTNKGTFEIANKTDVPEVEKKVQDKNDTAGTTSDWQDSADYDIGDSVPYKLTATLASNVADYDVYKVVFHDSLTAGLTYNGDAVVKLDGTTLVKGTDYTETYENNKLTITIADAKAEGAVNSSVITVEYTATLNTSAVVGTAGNPNTVYLEYSNNPNWVADGDGDGEDDGEDTPTGETPEDKVTVFTFKLVVDKVDEDGAALAGAGFTLYKKNAEGTYVAIGSEITGVTTFTWTGLDDGDYKLSETTVPAGYNKVADKEFTITADHDVLSDDPQLTALAGTDLNATLETGTLDTDVVNVQGTTLPETGGIGTTMFYVFGTIMVLAAAVLLITKKRMSVA